MELIEPTYNDKIPFCSCKRGFLSLKIVICEALLRVMRAFGCDTENLGIKEQNGFKCRRRFCLRIGFQLFSANLF